MGGKKTSKSGLVTILTVLCVFMVSFLQPVLYSSSGKVIGSCSADLDGDGHEEGLSLLGYDESPYGKFLSVKAADGKEYRYDLEYLNPWKLQAADVDGDGRSEVSLGVYKTSKFQPVLAKRPFLYSWDKKGGLAPKWLGSRLSRPFEDYVFSDIDRDGMDELISIELLSDGSKVLDTYNWKGFGFEGAGESEGYRDIYGLKVQVSKKNRISRPAAQVREDGDWRFAVFDYSDGRLKEQ